MHRGYIKLWRKTLDSEMLKNHKLWVFWTWCLLKATHKPIKITVGFQDVILEPGQFVFGLNKCSSETSITIQSLRTCLELLKKSEKLTIKTTNKFSIISIINWDVYQNENDSINKQINKQLTNNQQTTNKQVTTNKNVKELRECKHVEDKRNMSVNGYYKIFLDFFNSSIGTNHRYTKKTEAQLSARLTEGFSMDDIKKAIENASKDQFIMGQNDRNQRYLTPEFILRSDKLDKWLNHVPIVKDNRVSETGKKVLETLKRMEERGAFDS